MSWMLVSLALSIQAPTLVIKDNFRNETECLVYSQSITDAYFKAHVNRRASQAPSLICQEIGNAVNKKK